ncbi:cysteine hydrolase [Sedimentitalea sp. CY04]|uniref:Cysteine hydrolase n=1 Tax=Parasedimentitalea denitrificans TaxID=2211118 RepID=A0ABX0W5M0_9RHOB|nr:cysteine hydrolase family protein [Sedimentitalea sp. CY04]NIZ60938.1 cysteine hydrolase [Sedimentitalea sp. CY04]
MPKTTLIIVDIQNDYFDGGDWPLHQMERVSTNAAGLLANAREKDNLVVHIRHENDSPEAPFFRPGTVGAEIHASVAPKAGEVVLTKARANSFHDTGLLGLLHEAGIEAVTICGAMSQMCIDATARAAADYGFQVTVVEDACGAKEMAFGSVEVNAEQVHAAFMAPLAMGYAKVATTADLLS